MTETAPLARTSRDDPAAAPAAPATTPATTPAPAVPPAPTATPGTAATPDPGAAAATPAPASASPDPGLTKAYGLDPGAAAALVDGGQHAVTRQAVRVPAQLASAYKDLVAVAEQATLDRLLITSLVALAVFALLSVALAWWMAGRVLRPVHAITAAARRISVDNLSERLSLPGPRDELKELADTFDATLERLEAAVAAQRRFVANAAHELRTPLTIQRAAAEIGLADPDPDRVRRVRGELLALAARSERLIEGLLLLSTSDQGLDRREPAALDEIAAAVTAELTPVARERGVTVAFGAEPYAVEGDPVLLAHLVRNLVANAVAHNRPAGEVAVRVRPGGLEVTNTGAEISAEEVPRLFEPFHRRTPRRHVPGEGAGLGLSIVDSIARAHGASVTAEPNPGGGLAVRVEFPGRRPEPTAGGTAGPPPRGASRAR
ncbi:HAMP domain-containing protein [Bailinhaonella thermotolerans]|uniref:histidine kinase n=2 Tax=Bailinhaonella thermotolerans TaxID=1070861 RepID=A0A3A4ANP9_9ACTN|nr:HAMP domain-containing protein [Bailinhaonella thermotolerans]